MTAKANSMKNFMTGGSRRASLLRVMLLTTAVFVFLYRRFLFGSCVYLYSDIGSDSIAASYPILTQMAFLFQNKTFTFYTLSSGLGQETAATFLQFVNPLKFFMLFFDNERMIYAILLQLYLQSVVSALAFYGYIRHFVKAEPAAALSAMIWPFVSYTILWSQNLSYGTAVCMFTVSIYFIENLLEQQSLKNILLLSAGLAFFVATNYYFVYMTAVFAVIYLPLRAVFLGKPFLEFLRGVFFAALSAVYAILLSMVAVVCIVSNFTGSYRTGDLHSLTDYLTKAVSPSMSIGAFARLFSENMLGPGDSYRGPTNYYENAELFVSALFLAAFFYLLQQRKRWWKVLILTALSIFSIVHPLMRYILSQNHLLIRFGFMVCFLECIAVALFLSEILTEPNPKRLKRAGILAALFTFGSYALLFALEDRFSYELNNRTVLFSAIISLLCAALLVLLRKKQLSPKKSAVLLGLFLIGEILVMHHDSLYLRLYLTKETFSTQFYNSGTAGAIADVQGNDDSLYRIATTEEHDLSNEGEVNHFNGTTLRSNTNPQSLIDLALTFGTNEEYSPYFLSGYPQYFQFTLLSGKYVLENETSTHSDYTENSLFTKYGTYATPTAGVSKAVYENVNALPFGYLYKNQISSEDYRELDLVGRMHALTESWVDSDALMGRDKEDVDGETMNSSEDIEPATKTDSSSEGKVTEETDTTTESAEDTVDVTTLSTEELASIDGDDTRTDLIKAAIWHDFSNLETAIDDRGLTLTKTGEDANCYVDLPADAQTDDPNTSHYLYIRSAKKGLVYYSLQLFYTDADNEEANPTWCTTLYFNKTYPDSLILLPEGITGFRFDFDYCTEATISSLELITCREPLTHFEGLKSTDVRDISFENDRYSATLESDTNIGMFCVPLLYSEKWSATVNGEPVRIRNINGGLIGVPVTSGTQKIELVYTIPHFKAGVSITCAAWVAFLVLTAFEILRKKRAVRR